jgi:hypothetical protein
MHTVEILRNDEVLCKAGAANAAMLSAHISVSVQDHELGTLSVSGMNDLGGERQSHTYWLDELALVGGDALTLRFAEENAADPPVREIATDSEEHLKSQEWYEQQLKEHPLVAQTLSRIQPNAKLRLLFPGELGIVATLEEEREFISFSLTWNRWRPEYCRITMSSFSQQEALARTGGKKWFEGKLKPGESCVVEIES